jgi:hypothetical protein
MALAWAQRREELLNDCIVSPDVVAYLGAADNVSRSLVSRLKGLHQPVVRA